MIRNNDEKKFILMYIFNKLILMDVPMLLSVILAL